MKIIIDVMGSDKGADALVTGGVRAVREMSDLEVTLVGDAAEINAILTREKAENESRIRVVATTEVIGMEESPTLAFRRKKDSSMSASSQPLGPQFLYLHNG